jgi:hypothetical protein
MGASPARAPPHRCARRHGRRRARWSRMDRILQACLPLGLAHRRCQPMKGRPSTRPSANAFPPDRKAAQLVRARHAAPGALDRDGAQRTFAARDGQRTSNIFAGVPSASTGLRRATSPAPRDPNQAPGAGLNARTCRSSGGRGGRSASPPCRSWRHSHASPAASAPDSGRGPPAPTISARHRRQLVGQLARRLAPDRGVLLDRAVEPRLHLHDADAGHRIPARIAR